MRRARVMLPLTALSSAVLLLAGFAVAANPAEVLMEADRKFHEDSSKRGLAAWFDWFDEGAAIFPSSGPPVRGLANVREAYTAMKFDPQDLHWVPVHAELAASGDLGYTYGTWRRGETTGKYMTVWKRQKNGGYKVLADMGTPDAPPKN